MEQQRNRIANETSRGGIDQLNKGETDSPNQSRLEVGNQDGKDVQSRGGIDQLNKGGANTPGEDLES